MLGILGTIGLLTIGGERTLSNSASCLSTAGRNQTGRANELTEIGQYGDRGD